MCPIRNKSQKQKALKLPKSAGPLQNNQAISSPSPEPLHFPVVGIGASAGGLKAIESFFSGMPAGAGPGMAFVVVQHLAPDHKSILTDLIRRYTSMQVFEIEHGMTVRPNCTYIIPPNCYLAFQNGILQLLEPDIPHGQRMPIDFFFRSLARDQRELAICIVLSGSGSDGTLGVRAVKGEGGMVMVQSPGSAEYEGMPHSALSTGMVDFELLPAEMPVQLLAYVSNAYVKHPLSKTYQLPKVENTLDRVFNLLKVKTHHDFSQYKPSTVIRRIERRMAVNQFDSLEQYVSHAQQNPAEVEELFRDLLIGVTNFFRDPEAFQFIEEQITPKLFSSKPAGSTIRVWVPGCSTGEEAYSMAILLYEYMETVKQSYHLQIFATDIDSHAIQLARVGMYPASIASDVSQERLTRFFSTEPDGNAFRIHKGIRNLLVFSEQDVIRDPPFSKLDMICCRNLLIYMGSELQKKLLPLFHYALNANGILFLGSSESIGESGHLFGLLSRKFKIYQRKNDTSGSQRTALSGLLLPISLDPGLRHGATKTASAGKLSMRELTEQTLLQEFAPTAALVNKEGDIFYLHGRAGMFLEPASGEVTVYNILKMAREGLRSDLAIALHKVSDTKEPINCQGVRVKTHDRFMAVNLRVCMVAASEDPLFLVLLEEASVLEITGQDLPKENSDLTPGRSFEVDMRIEKLKQELEAKKEYLQTANEELETSNEELRSSNEEMQSVNEELQSTNEELETSKEELQSVNEELATVNAELQAKVIDLSRINNDMNNLLAGTGIGTVFVDQRLNIMRFTPAVTCMINLIPGDMGRPLAHIASNLIGYDRLVPDAHTVLDTLIPKEVDVQTYEKRWYTLRIQPYRTLENVIEGAVITFMDITETKQAQESIKRSESLIRFAQKLTHAGAWVWDIEHKSTFWTEEMYRLVETEPGGGLPGMPEQIALIKGCFLPKDLPFITDALRSCAEQGASCDIEFPFTTVKGRQLWIHLYAEPELENGKITRVLGFCTSITKPSS